ncbi:MAG: LysM peptidoglycan-binding domain-containing protein, partial [Saprospiraceae bacterium]
YGIRLDRLYKINRMEKGTEPAYGMNLSIKKKINKKRKIKLRDESTDPVTSPPMAEPQPTVPSTSEPDPKPQVPVVVTPPVPTVPTPTTQPEVEEPVVTVPTVPTTPEKEYHTVERGDTLYSISRKFSISVSELKRLNGLANNIISIGQELRIR